MSRNVTAYEFFAGGGMARLGLGDGWRVTFANDFDPVKAAVYRANHGEDHFREGDVFALSAADLPGRADLAWASSPCQDFSLAGGRAGLAGGRSSAFFGFWRLMQALDAEGRAPPTIVIENVVGLLTSHGGADFTALCQVLAEAGYQFGALEIDAAHFLAQSRPRVFVVATRADTHGLTGESLFQTRAVKKAHEALPAALKTRWRWWRLPAPPARNIDLAGVLEPDDAVRWHSPARTAALLALLSPLHRARLEALQKSGERRVGGVFRRMRGTEQRAEVRFDGLAGCLRTPRGGSSRQSLLVLEGDRVRARLLSAREGARLMGLADSYAMPKTTTDGLHVVGDGVAVPVVRWLAAHLLEPLAGAGQSLAAAE